jgi:multicomponent Na+:H+ antiporter subunit F
MNNFLIGLTTFIILLIFVSMYRVLKGPTIADRVVAINVIATKITIAIVVISILTNQQSYIDVALVYALIGFIASIAIVRYLEKGKVV